MISIIIPVLNEEKSIGKLIQHLFDSSSLNQPFEILIVDGGSTDRSQEMIKELIRKHSSIPLRGSAEKTEDLIVKIETKKNTVAQSKIHLIHSKKGRAHQMNTGAKMARGNILYFLHADTFPPSNYDQLIIDEVQKGNEAGCFRMEFDSDHWWLKTAGWFTKFNWRACRGGDQSQFITKTLYEAIGGFDESYVIYEDNVLINKLFERNQFVVIQEKITTSSRLYQKHGVWKLQYHFCAIHFKRWLGEDADKLHAYYRKHIS